MSQVVSQAAGGPSAWGALTWLAPPPPAILPPFLQNFVQVCPHHMVLCCCRLEPFLPESLGDTLPSCGTSKQDGQTPRVAFYQRHMHLASCKQDNACMVDFIQHIRVLLPASLNKKDTVLQQLHRQGAGEAAMLACR